MSYSENPDEQDQPENPASTRHHRVRIRQLIVFGAIALVLVALIIYAAGVITNRWKIPFGPGAAQSTSATAKPTCTLATTRPAKPKSVKVQVQNGTKVTGLAGRTSASLKDRDFRTKDAVNAKKQYSGSAEVVYGKGQLAAGAAVAAQVKGADLKLVNDNGAVVKLILGTKFTDLASKKNAAKELKKAVTDKDSCPTTPK